MKYHFQYRLAKSDAAWRDWLEPGTFQDPETALIELCSRYGIKRDSLKFKQSCENTYLIYSSHYEWRVVDELGQEPYKNDWKIGLNEILK